MKIVNVLYDNHPLSLNAKDSLFFEDNWDVRSIEVDPDNFNKNSDEIHAMEGLVISVLSPRIFSLYRASLYQLIKFNDRIYFEDYSTDLTKVHKGSFVGFNTNISGGVRVGIMTYIGCNSVISPNVVIGNYCWIGHNVFIGSGVKISDNVTILDNVILGAGAKIGKYNEIRLSVDSNSTLSQKTIETDFFGAVAYFSGI